MILLKNIIILLISFLLTIPWALLSARDDYQSFGHLTQLKLKRRNLIKTWMYGYEHVLGFPPQENLLKYADIFVFNKASNKELKDLHKKVPRLAELVKFSSPQSLNTFDQEIHILTSKLDQNYMNHPEKLKEIFKQHYSSDDFIDDDLFDNYLGLHYDSTELKASHLSLPYGFHVGWPKSMTQTRYEEIRLIFKNRPPKKGDVVYDLGAGYGKVLFYGAAVFPEAQFNGVEIVKERVEQTEAIRKKQNLSNIKFIQADALKTDFSDGTYFYFYNPFPDMMKEVIENLRKISLNHKITIVSLGPCSKDFKATSWLKLIKEYPEKNHLSFFESK